ncbi:MAG: hypothetical protein LBE70_02415, partial [Nitrososphaerota archaeon]|nr:hypothetical protein [Nitrososphaerota archaeon]
MIGHKVDVRIYLTAKNRSSMAVKSHDKSSLSYDFVGKPPLCPFLVFERERTKVPTNKRHHSQQFIVKPLKSISKICFKKYEKMLEIFH